MGVVVVGDGDGDCDYAAGVICIMPFEPSLFHNSIHHIS